MPSTTRKQHRSTVLWRAARATVSVLQRMGYRCAVHGPFAVHAIVGSSALPSLWTVAVYVDTNAKLTKIYNSIVRIDSDHFSCTGRAGLQYRYGDADPAPEGQHTHTTCTIILSTTLANFTFAHTPDLEKSNLPIVPYRFLIYELLLQWKTRRIAVKDGKDPQCARTLDDLTHALLRDSRYVTNRRGTFSPTAAQEMADLADQFSRTSTRRKTSLMRLGILTQLEEAEASPAFTLSPHGQTPLPAAVLDSSLTIVPAARSGDTATTTTSEHTAVQPQLAAPRRTWAMRPCAQKLDTQTPCVKEAATAAINTLASLGYSAVIFGGLACSLYGAPRAPKDADILALPPSNEANTEDTEVLKNAIMRTDSTRFYTVRARDPGATYRVLYFRSDGHEPWKCKVDILLPGILHLPALPTARIVWIEGFPVIPFALLLLQKLQAYDDHRHSREQHKFTRSQQDEEDINKLLDIRERVLEVIQEHPWHDRAVFSEEFMTLSRKRVAEYARIFIETWLWRDLGFTI